MVLLTYTSDSPRTDMCKHIPAHEPLAALQPLRLLLERRGRTPAHSSEALEPEMGALPLHPSSR